MDDIQAKVIEILARDCGIDPAGIQPTTKLDDLALDSLDRVELAIELESLYGIEILEMFGEGADMTVSGIANMVREAMV